MSTLADGQRSASAPVQPQPLRAPDTPLGRERLARGWSQTTLARALSLQARDWFWDVAAEDSLKVFVSRWENGVMRPSPTYQVLLCAIFHATPHELGFTGPCPANQLPDRVRALEALVHDLASRLGEVAA